MFLFTTCVYLHSTFLCLQNVWSTPAYNEKRLNKAYRVSCCVLVHQYRPGRQCIPALTLLHLHVCVLFKDSCLSLRNVAMCCLYFQFVKVVDFKVCHLIIYLLLILLTIYNSRKVIKKICTVVHAHCAFPF